MSVAVSLGQSERIARYQIPDNELAVGSTLGSPYAVCVLKASGALQKIFSTEVGETLFGALIVRFYDCDTGMYLAPRPGGTFVIHPEHQEYYYSLSGELAVHENVYVISSEPGQNKADPPGVYFQVGITNEGRQPKHLAVYAFAELRGETGHNIATSYKKTFGAIFVGNANRPDLTRVFGALPFPDSFEVSQDAAKATADQMPGALSRDISPGSQPLGILLHRLALAPRDRKELCYQFSFGSTQKKARSNYKALLEPNKALGCTKAYYHEFLQRSVVFTPSDEINRGVLWAKANMIRVLIDSPTGWCFVNDPTNTSNSVARDTAWFAYGADYLVPEFARESLLAYVRNQKKNGMIVEYYDIRTGKACDYDLNVNDNAPLLLLALWHHYNTTGDKAFLSEIYPCAAKAARYILSQRNHQGLVWCKATGTGGYGIVGWRNVIQNYRLSGATTELNSECYAALSAVAKMACTLDKHDESAVFAKQSQELKEAINTHLKNPSNGLYYLNIDLDGRPRSDITSDLVFPVIFNVADHATAVSIISRLRQKDFWTHTGMRTVPRDAPNYNPNGKNEGAYGLLGGIWVGVAF